MKDRGMNLDKPKIVVIGGGTGSFTVLTGLKEYPVRLTAVVSMADDGGSTGMLRDELGVLPPGDVRQCLVALSRSDRLMRELMSYRFEHGHLQGHNFGNLLLSALEKVTGSFEVAVEKASDILRLAGRVIPATLTDVELVATLQDGTAIHGQSEIHQANLTELASIQLAPKARANPKAVQAIMEADAIVIGPGDFYSSLVPNLLIQGIPKAICASKARKIYVANLMTKAGHTDGLSVAGFAASIERYLGCPVDDVIYNTFTPTAKLLKEYSRGGETMAAIPQGSLGEKYHGADLVSRRFPKVRPGDPLVRTFIRHDSRRLAELIMELVKPLPR